MGTTLSAQQDALFSQYMFNMLVLNPGYAGTSETMNFTLINRQQWVGLAGAPKTSTFSVNTPLRNENVGLGLYAYSDVLGPVNGTGALGTYSYKVKLGPGNLSFGLQFGFKSETIDWNMLDMQDENPAYDRADYKDVNLDANFGIYYYSKKYYFGVSSKQLLEKDIGLAEVNGQYAVVKLLRHFYAMAGVAIPLTDKVVFKPATLIKYVDNAPIQVDLNASFLYNKMFWLGASFRSDYRTESTLVFMTEMLIRDRIRVGYSYDVFLSSLHVTNRGSHEIMLGFDLPIFNKRMKTVRYF